MTSKIKCQCGSIINHNYFNNHIYSNKHKTFILNNKINDFSEYFNEDLFINLNEKMNELDDIKTSINEFEYLNICNKLLKEYKYHKSNSIKTFYENLIFQENRLYNKFISELIYKNHPIFNYQLIRNIYYIYYYIDNNLYIFKIDHINYILNNL